MSIFIQELESLSEDVKKELLQEAFDLELIEELESTNEALGQKNGSGMGVRRNRLPLEERKRRFIGRAIMILARNEKDPDYDEWKKSCTKTESLRNKLDMKFRKKAEQSAEEFFNSIADENIAKDI
jgi:hypothetical protein